MDLSFDDAMRLTEQSVSALEVICKCAACTYGEEEGVNMSILPSRSWIVGLAYAIRKVTSAMACTVQDPDGPQLLPAVQGIVELCRDGKSPDPIDHGLEIGDLQNPLVEGEGRKSDWNISSFYWNALGLRHVQHRSAVFHYHTLATASVLFQGSQPRGSGLSFRDVRPSTATSRRGVCCFIDALRSISCQADTLCRIHVFAGHIQYKNRSYEFVFDGNIPWDKAWTGADKEPAQIEGSLDSIPDAIDTVPDITKIQALATEVSEGSSIACYYRVSISNSSVLVAPGKITECVLDRTGLISCDGHDCRRRLAFPCSVVRGGWQVSVDHQPNLAFSSRLGCCLWMYQDETARCLVMMSHHRLSSSNQHFVYLRRQECLPCCTTRVLRDSSTMFSTPTINPPGHHNAVAHII